MSQVRCGLGGAMVHGGSSAEVVMPTIASSSGHLGLRSVVSLTDTFVFTQGPSLPWQEWDAHPGPRLACFFAHSSLMLLDRCGLVLLPS